MLKPTHILSCVILILIGVLCNQFKQFSHVCKERDSSQKRTESLLMQLDTFRTTNGSLVAQIEELELSRRDFERIFADDAKEIASLRKRNEELERLVKSQSKTKVEFITEIRDSIIYIGGQLDTLRVLHWADSPWVSFEGEILGDNILKASLLHHDEIDVAVFLEWKKFLWFRLWIEGCDVKVVSHNPYTESLNVSSVSITNKRK